ncbi:MAG TPA: DUF3489 domain-containing protein [Roseiarcus sp.]
MSSKLNDTQLVLLSAASRRDDHCLVPPIGPKRSQPQRAIAKLLEAGLVKEIRAKAGAPIWRREEETGHTYAFKLTAAGIKAIAVDDISSSQTEADPHADQAVGTADSQPERSNPPTVDRPDGVAARNRKSPRSGTKIAEVIELLQRGDGATLTELAVTTGWLIAYHARGAHRLAQARLLHRD